MVLGVGLFAFSGDKRPSSLRSRNERVLRSMSGTSPSTQSRPASNYSDSATMYAASASGSGSFHPCRSFPNARIWRLVMSMVTMGMGFNERQERMDSDRTGSCVRTQLEIRLVVEVDVNRLHLAQRPEMVLDRLEEEVVGTLS